MPTLTQEELEHLIDRRVDAALKERASVAWPLLDALRRALIAIVRIIEKCGNLS